MFGKRSTRILLIAIAALAVVWVLSERFSTRAKTRTFRPEVIRLDTASVTTITVRSPKTGPEGLTIERRGNAWVVVTDVREYRADAQVISKVFRDLAVVRTDHVIGPVDKHRDAQGLSDSAATRLDLVTGGGTTSILIGRETYDTQGKPRTAVMVPGDELIFGLNTLLMSLRELNLDGLRPHVLVTGDPHDWQRLTFTCPQDTGYVFERTGERWLVDS